MSKTFLTVENINRNNKREIHLIATTLSYKNGKKKKDKSQIGIN